MAEVGSGLDTRLESKDLECWQGGVWKVRTGMDLVLWHGGVSDLGQPAQ